MRHKHAQSVYPLDTQGAECGLTSGSRTTWRNVHPVLHHLLHSPALGRSGLFGASTDLVLRGVYISGSRYQIVRVLTILPGKDRVLRGSDDRTIAPDALLAMMTVVCGPVSSCEILFTELTVRYVRKFRSLQPSCLPWFRIITSRSHWHIIHAGGNIYCDFSIVVVVMVGSLMWYVGMVLYLVKSCRF